MGKERPDKAPEVLKRAERAEVIRTGEWIGEAREEGALRSQGPSIMAQRAQSSLLIMESRARAGLGSGWLDILGAEAASLRAERMQNQELARPQTLSVGCGANSSDPQEGESVEVTQESLKRN